MELGSFVLKLQNYFEKRRDIDLAFLFGSAAKGHAGLDSDVDVAVYFVSEAQGRWTEDEKEFPGETELALDLEKIVGREVDLVVLNRAFPTVAEAALRGLPLLIRNRKVYVDFLTRMTSEAIDFREFVNSWWQLKERRLE